MELTGFLTFIGMFIAILAVLIGIAYYGIKDVSYEDTVKSKLAAAGSVNAAKPPKKVKSKPAAPPPPPPQQPTSTAAATGGKAKAKKQQQRDHSSSGTTQNESAEEEEPIVIIRDPFTNQFSSRFAGATSKRESAAAVHSSVVNKENTSGSFFANAQAKTAEKFKPKQTATTTTTTTTTIMTVAKPIANGHAQRQTSENTESSKPTVAKNGVSSKPAVEVAAIILT